MKLTVVAMTRDAFIVVPHVFKKTMPILVIGSSVRYQTHCRPYINHVRPLHAVLLGQVLRDQGLIEQISPRLLKGDRVNRSAPILIPPHASFVIFRHDEKRLPLFPIDYINVQFDRFPLITGDQKELNSPRTAAIYCTRSGGQQFEHKIYVAVGVKLPLKRASR